MTATEEKPARPTKGDEESQTSTSDELPIEEMPPSEKVVKDPFLVTLDESELPTSLPKIEKWATLMVICTSALCLTCASSMVSCLYPDDLPGRD